LLFVVLSAYAVVRLTTVGFQAIVFHRVDPHSFILQYDTRNEGGVMLTAPPLSSSGFTVGDPTWSLNAAHNLQCREFQTTVFQLASYDVS